MSSSTAAVPSFATTDAALVALRALLRQIEPLLAPPDVALGQWRDRVALRYAPPRPRSTRLRMRQAVAELIDLAGGPEVSLRVIDAELIGRFAVLIRGSGRRAETVNGLLRGVRTACALAVEWGWLGVSPFRKFCEWAPPDAEVLRSRHHARAAIRGVLELLAAEAAAGWEAGRLHALACVWAYTGLRRNEALRLRVEECDLARGVLWVRGTLGRRLKTLTSAAAVPMPSALVEVLRGWVKRCGSEWLFPGARSGKPWVGGCGGKRAGDCLAAAGVRAGVRGLTPHTLRHSLATHLTTHWGITPRQVQLVLRHASVAMQSHYVHPEISDLVGLVAGVRY